MAAEHRFGARYIGITAADHHRELSGDRAFGSTAHGCIDDRHAHGFELARELSRGLRMRRGRIDDEDALASVTDQALRSRHNFAQRSRPSAATR